MNIYLDIDGVILTKDGSQMRGLGIFLDEVFRISGGNVYWLTTHCKENSTERVFQHLKDRIDPILLNKMNGIKPTKWGTLKTEAIDFNNEFIWFDDNVLTIEQKILEKNNCLHSWIKVEDNLEEIVESLRLS